MISWLLSQMAWQLSFICFTWALDQRKPLTMLHETCTLFQNLFHVVLMATSSMSEQVRQSPEADSKSKSAMFSLNSSWVESSPQRSVLSSQLCSSVLPEAPTPLMCASSGVSGSCVSPCDVLCPLLTLASAVSAQALLPGQLQGHHWGTISLCVLGIDEEPDG